MMEGHPIAEHNKKFDRIDKVIETIQEKLFKSGERISAVEFKTAAAERRLDDREEEIKAIREVAFSVRSIAEEMKEMKCEVKDIKTDFGTRISNIERRPGDTAIKFWHVFVVALITGLASMVMTSVALGFRL